MTPKSTQSYPVRGRLAPSPTGLLHLGNAWAFLLAWLEVRVAGGELVLRMEDIDPERSRQEWVDGIIQDLAWLGLDWDEGPLPGGMEKGPCGPYTQSARHGYYEQALARLQEQGLVYPCYCTRKELRELASAPQIASCHDNGHGKGSIPYSHLQRWVGDLGAVYPGLCRHLTYEERKAKEQAGRKPALRLCCEQELDPDILFFNDTVLGVTKPGMEALGGDFALRRSDGVWAYQLAVVVDDACMGINSVVRGEDILVSTPRQILLFHFLGAQAPRYAHIPLLHDEKGDRLAKRHQSLSLNFLRHAGVPPQAVIGWLAHIAGLAATPAPVSTVELAAQTRRENGMFFPWSKLPSGPVTVPDCLLAQLLATG